MTSKYLNQKNQFTRPFRFKLPSKKWFEQKYFNEKQSVYDIANDLNCSVNTIYRRLKYYEIKIMNHSNSISGERHPRWNGGKRKSDGYIRIYSPNHPNVASNRTVYEHRLVMEKKIGRYLTKEEVVHHLNGIRDDNRPENLVIMKNNSKHIKEEFKLKKHLYNRIIELEKKLKKCKIKY